MSNRTVTIIAAIFGILVMTLLKGLEMVELPAHHSVYGAGLCLIMVSLLCLTAGVGFLVALQFRHRISSPNLRSVLIVISFILICVIALLNIFQFTELWIETSKQKLFLPELHWGWYGLFSLNYALTLVWGVLMGLTNTKPGLSQYDLTE